jgi:uncharacterized protein (DUF1697 family)
VTRYAVLLRGVNVGGHGKLAMADLRAAIEAAGFHDVATYLNSGNATLTAPGRPAPSTVAARIGAELERVTGRPVGLLVRSHARLTQTVAANPYPVDKPAWLHVLFCDPDPVRDCAVPAEKLGPDEFTLGPGCAYLRFVNSPGRSRLAELVTRAALPDGGVATARNWNTLLALVERTA